MPDYTREQIDALLRRNDRAVEVGIVRLNQLQTVDERAAYNTKYSNNVGFQSCYARSGTYMANWLLSGHPLTGKWLDKARKICLRHSRQLVDIANNVIVLPSILIPHHQRSL